MLKRYTKVYKRMQKRRSHTTTFILFDQWLIRSCDYYKHVFGLFFIRPIWVRLKFIRRFKRRFRKLFKRRRLFLLFFCKPNFLVHAKHKNARMGKGKGSPGHWVYKSELHRPFAVLGGIHKLRALSILRYFKKFLHPYIYLRSRVQF